MSEGGRYGSLKDNVEYGGYDLAPDEFTFHFMGKSGKFFLDQDGNWRVRSNDNIEVIYDCANSSNLIGSLFESYPYASATGSKARPLPALCYVTTKEIDIPLAMTRMPLTTLQISGT